jgi:hypothetical protein
VLFVGVFCGSDLFTGVCGFVLYFTLYLVTKGEIYRYVFMCVVLYIVFSYALFLYLHITSF